MTTQLTTIRHRLKGARLTRARLKAARLKGAAQLRVPLLALLALAAVLAVATGLAPPDPSAAQSGTTYITNGNTTPCGPGGAAAPANPTAVINSGHFAMFDLYWDNTTQATSGKTLNNNLCPPEVTNTTTVGKGRGATTTETFTRAASNTDIRETLFHIPTSNEVTLAATTVMTTEDGETYPSTFGVDRFRFLGADGDEVWIVSKHDEEHLNPGFSTALLPDDFVKTGQQVQFELEAFRVPGKTVAERGKVYAFDNSGLLHWRSDVPHGLIGFDIAPDIRRYHHFHWGFTKPGIYQIQVHARATPLAKYLAGNKTVTSEVRRYTFQVGELADLGVTVSPDNATPAAGSNVVLTYTASNSGPDAAGAVKVSAPLPTGLTYVSATTANGSYASGTGEWTVGSLAGGASATLAVTATVGSGASGDTITPTAYIRDTGDHPDLDALTGNNHATATLRPAAAAAPANSNPRFRIVHSIAENSIAGTPAGAPVGAADADGDRLTYSLSGQHAERFTVDGQGQIAVSECGVMDYEAHAAYPLTLSVRDSKNSAGQADTANDDSIGVTINLTDVVNEPTNPNAPRVTLQPAVTTMTVGEVLTLTAVLSAMPACGLTVDHYWSEQINDQGDLKSYGSDHYSKRSAEFGMRSPGTRVYWIGIRNARDSDGRPIANFPVLGASLRVTWVAAPPTPTPTPTPSP